MTSEQMKVNNCISAGVFNRIRTVICASALLCVVLQSGAAPPPSDSTELSVVGPNPADKPLTDEQAELKKLILDLHDDIDKGKGTSEGPPPAKPTPPPRAKKARRIVRVTETNEYDGILGQAAVRVSLNVAAHTRDVQGDLYFLNNPTRLYTFKGKNYQNGRFRLILLNDTIPIAAVTLEKTTDSGQVRWEGKLRDREGKTNPFFITRSLKSKRLVRAPHTVADFEALKGFQLYTGTVRDRRTGMVAEAFFKLQFSRGRCSGYYYQKYRHGQTSSILRLEGENKPEELKLREWDNDKGIPAIFQLEKIPIELSGAKVIWKGTLANVRDNIDIKDVEFSRQNVPQRRR